MALFLKDPAAPPSDVSFSLPPAPDLALPKHCSLPPPPLGLFQSPFHPYHRINMLSSIPCPKAPSPPPITISLLTPARPEAMCEAAARLLFMNVKWAKNVPAFTSLSLSDRLLLLEETWRDLFVIGTSQFLYPIDLKILFDGKNPRLDVKQVEEFNRVLLEFAKIRPDNNEYSCLRAIVLFKTSLGVKNSNGSPSSPNSETRKLQDLPAIAAFQGHSQVILNEVS